MERQIMWQYSKARLCIFAGTLTVASLAGTAGAQLVHGDLSGLPGPAFSRFASGHGVMPLTGTSAVPIFNDIVPGLDPGYMESAGGGFPVWGGAPIYYDTPTPIFGQPITIPVTGTFAYNAAPAPAFGFGGAAVAASPRPTGGVAMTTWNVTDDSPVGGAQASIGLYTHTVDYVNTGPGRVITVGHGIATSFTLSQPGDYSCLGINSLFQVGTGIGDNFVETARFAPSEIYMASDGLGGLADVDSGGNGPGLTLLAPNFGLWIQWSTVSFFVPENGVIRMIAGMSNFLDPSSMSLIDFPLEYVDQLGELNFVASSNANLIVPSPGSVVVLLGGVFLLRRRR